MTAPLQALIARVLLCCGLASMSAAAQDAAGNAASGPPAKPPEAHSLQLPRAYEVWIDELPAHIDPAQLELVILSPDTRCKPPVRKLMFGLTAQDLAPITRSLCQRIETFMQAPPQPLPIATRIGTQALVSRQPADIVAALQPPAQRRYVALLYWDWRAARNDTKWLFEEAVIDRETGRWVWHAGRAHDISHVHEYTRSDEVQALRSVLQHALPRDVLSRAWWRDDVPVPGSRWVPLSELATWQPGERAGLAIINTYSRSSDASDGVTLKLWPADGAEIPWERLADTSRNSSVARQQTSPILSTYTHALLELPAGDYAMRVYADVEHLRLEPGRLTVLNVHRSARFNGKTFTLEPEAWWRRTVLEQERRHAFLAEPARKTGVVPSPYFTAPAPVPTTPRAAAPG